VDVPLTTGFHPNSAQPTVIEKLHAQKVAMLPLRNDQGSYDRHTPPDLSSSAAIGDYIQMRTAAWKEHLHRQRARRAAHAAKRRTSRSRSRSRKASR